MSRARPGDSGQVIDLEGYYVLMADFLVMIHPDNRIDRQVAFGKPNEILRTTKSPCGSGLAREVVITLNIDADSHAAFASKPHTLGGWRDRECKKPLNLAIQGLCFSR
ncbi:hypothetical protein [Pseudomonas sp. NPDC086278]|uniref:hypothetical protein n=1 Tax=Pseudomonas sp. NPDC086278 TaxID=3390646 RepID=UPI003D08CE25